MKEWFKDWFEFVAPYYKRHWKAYSSGIGTLILTFGALAAWDLLKDPYVELDDATKTVALCVGAAFDSFGVRLDERKADTIKYGRWSSKGAYGYVAQWKGELGDTCLLYTSPSPRDGLLSRMPSSA